MTGNGCPWLYVEGNHKSLRKAWSREHGTVSLAQGRSAETVGETLIMTSSWRLFGQMIDLRGKMKAFIRGSTMGFMEIND